MSKVKYITGYFFGRASYRVEDGRGDVLELEIDYKNNKFEVTSSGKIINENFRKEVKQVALGLLKRKHQTNFVDRLVV